MTAQDLPFVADLYGDLYEAEISSKPVRLRDYIPGLSVTIVAALAAAYIADHYGAPLMLMGLLFGLAFNFANADPKLQPGLGFASRSLLRWGIILMGFRITISQIVGLGPWAFAAIALIVMLVICVGIVTARALKLGTAFGLLCGGAVAICGASAALAFAALLGEKRATQAQLTLTLVGIAAASAIAMSIYPVLMPILGFNDAQSGFVMGASIHDVAQALGAGYSISNSAGETATIVKLTRVALLVPALFIAAMFLDREEVSDKENSDPAKSQFPYFVLGFLGAVLVNSFVPIPSQATEIASKVAGALLLLAVVATGIRSPMQLLLRQGWRASLPVIIATLTSFCAAVVVAYFL
jgi:uncharacterized integral membrane protein (TIGR00698 family)